MRPKRNFRGRSVAPLGRVRLPTVSNQLLQGDFDITSGIRIVYTRWGRRNRCRTRAHAAEHETMLRFDF